MRIYQPVRFQGARDTIQESALIDTGAGISMIPLSLARMIGAWRRPETMTIRGVHGQEKTLPLGVVEIYFPSLGNRGERFVVVVSDVEQEPIIGMDILSKLGISIDAKTGRLSTRNEVWEAFKTFSAIFWAIEILELVFEEE